MQTKILIVEINQDIEDTIACSVKLELSERTFSRVSGVKKAADLTEATGADLVVIDANTTESPVLDLVKQIRLSSEVPVLVLSKSNDEMERVQLLESGADDCANKPINLLDLLVRIKALLRRISLSYHDEYNLPPLITDDVAIDFDSRDISVKGKKVHLTPIEYGLLSALVRNEGKFLDQKNLKNRVWGSAEHVDSSAIKKYIRRLRIKLGDDARPHRMFICERGVGYKFVSPKRTKTQAN